MSMSISNLTRRFGQTEVLRGIDQADLEATLRVIQAFDDAGQVAPGGLA